MTTDEFIALCDGIGVVNKLKTKPTYHEEKVRIHDKLADASLERMRYREVLNLRTGFIYLSEIDDTRDYSTYFYILEKITEHFNASVKEVASWSNDVWRDVIHFVKSLPDYPRTNAFVHEEFRKQERERARAALRLRCYGVALSVKDNDLELANTEGVIAHINTLARRIGGYKGLMMLLEKIPYITNFGRYLEPHQGNLPMMSMVEPEVPYGFLFNLFLKYLSDDCSSIDADSDFKELKDVTTDLCLALYNSQKMDIWNDIARMSTDIVNLMHELVIRYDIYTLPQTGTSFTTDWCRFLTKWVKRNPRCTPMLRSFVEYHNKVMNVCLSAAQKDKCVIISSTSREGKLIKDIPLAFQSYLIKDAALLNANFDMPNDFLKVDYMMHPIYSKGDTYMLLPSPLGVWCWFESLKRGIVRLERSVGKELGLAMEEFIRNKMQSHGIVSHTGNYSFEDVEGECDFLVQALKGDMLIESKKKSFSRNALEGDDHFIWSELYDFLYSQMQCVRTEYGVRKHSPLKFTDKKGDRYSYTWVPQYTDSEGVLRERCVSKVTMTLKEYGPMQDNILVTQLIENLLGKHIDSTFPTAHYSQREIDDFKKYFAMVNDTLDTMTDYYTKLGVRNPAFHCRFYSMEQLYCLIRNSNNADDLHREIAEVYVSTGTQNFWNELALRLQMGIGKE
jgi:hypothetical protein